jgi:hypothetical protein
MPTLFKDIKDYEGCYQVSNDGQIRSINRISSNGHKLKGRLLAQCYKRGYNGRIDCLMVNLCKNGVSKTIKVHRVVAVNFIGDEPNGHMVCHKDGDATNNKVGNLYYGTRKDNVDDASKHGTTPKGSKHWKAKLKESDALHIKNADYSIRGSVNAMASKFGVNREVVRLIRRGMNWRHI